MSENPETKNPFENDPLFREVMKVALAIQDRFAAEPIYATTGKGYLRSVGVSELQEIKVKQKDHAEKTTR